MPSLSVTVWLLIIWAFFWANLPFFSPRFLGIMPLDFFRNRKVHQNGGHSSHALSHCEMGFESTLLSCSSLTLKPFGLILIEWLIGYILVGLTARYIEASMGSVYPQQWAFFVVTLCLFAVFAFPGFVYRYLRRPGSI